MAKQSVEKQETEGKVPTRRAAAEHPISELRRQMDRLFEDFTRGWGWPSIARWRWPGEALDVGRAPGGVLPVDLDVSEDDKAVLVKADLPGMDKDDVDISIDNGMLTIRGEKKEEREEQERDYYVAERHYGSFRRSFRLPESVDEDKVSASFKQGVLEVTLPKRPEAQRKAKKIEVKSS